MVHVFCLGDSCRPHKNAVAVVHDKRNLQRFLFNEMLPKTEINLKHLSGNCFGLSYPKAEQVEKLKLQIAFVLLPENRPMKTIRT